jgi:hypothetical protein
LGRRHRGQYLLRLLDLRTSSGKHSSQHGDTQQQGGTEQYGKDYMDELVGRELGQTPQTRGRHDQRDEGNGIE